MGKFTFEVAKEAPKDLAFRFGVANKYGELFSFIKDHAVIGEWIKIDVTEDSKEALDKSLHTMSASIRAWKLNELKKGTIKFDLALQKKLFNDTSAQLWMQVKAINLPK